MNARVTCGLLLLTLCIAVAMAPAWAAPAAPAGPTKAELEGIAKELETAAASWAQTGKDDPALMNKIKGLVYDDASIRALVDVLNVKRTDPVNLYVTYNLLEPLTLAKSELIRKNLGLVDPFRRLIEYKTFPKQTQAELAGLRAPANASIEERARLLEINQKKQEVKMANDKVIRQHNDLAYRLDKLTHRLCLMADDPREDSKVLQTAVNSEAQGNALWSDILGMICGEAPHLSEMRAKFFYDGLKTWGKPLLMKKANYREYSAPDIPASTPIYDAQLQAYPGIEIYQTINRLCGPAKQPALVCPSSQEVDAMQPKTVQNKPTTLIKSRVILHP